jgi:IMP dehydrogenase
MNPGPDVRSSASAVSDAPSRDLQAMVRGCTFDDFLFAPQFSVLERRDPAAIDLSCRLSEHITLKRPIVSANMDTVTRAPMAIVQAEEGGIGIIDRGFRAGDIESQVREVEIVKRTQHGVIADPYTIAETASIAEAADAMARSRVGTLVVVDGARRLRGLLTERDLRFLADTPGGAAGRVADRMTPVDELVVREAPITIDEAERVMIARKIKKLPLVDDRGVLAGLVTARDIVKQKRLPFATRDRQGRLRVGAAIGAKGDYLERAAELIRAGVDVIVIDIAHGHSVVMARAIDEFRRRFGDFELIAGNVATREGATFLAERGANGIKVGIGPGGGCTTRLNTSFGVPQLQALVDCSSAVDGRIPIIADGGVRRDGALIEALLFGGDSVMLGSAFAGTQETPGEIIHKSVLLPESQRVVKVPFKVLRGMASIEAIKDRLDVEDADILDVQALGAEGLEISVPARGSARPVVIDMIKHVCSAISYGGARSLAELKTFFRAHPERYLVKLSAAARRESYER